jgi:hypothetical protein
MHAGPLLDKEVMPKAKAPRGAGPEAASRPAEQSGGLCTGEERGEVGTMLPAVTSMDQLNHLLSLIMHHFNRIISGFESDPRELITCWEAVTHRCRELGRPTSATYPTFTSCPLLVQNNVRVFC